MDSDDDYECEDINEELLAGYSSLGNVDFDALLAGQVQTISEGADSAEGFFELPEPVTTEGFNDARTQPQSESLITHSKTFDRIQLKHLGKDHEEALKTMVGDFSKLEELMEPVDDSRVPSGSLKKITLVCGTGRSVMEGDLVFCHSILSIETMDDILESTYKGRPTRFRVGNGEVLPILDAAARTMKVGEQSKFLGTPDLAFGKLGVPLMNNQVPGDCRALIFIEMLEARETKKDDSLAGLSTKERQELGFEELYKYALEMKKDGNDEMSIDEFDMAVLKYKEGLECILDMDSVAMNADNKEKYLNLHYELLNNLSIAYFKQDSFKNAAKYAHKATLIPRKGDKTKAYYRYAKAMYELGKFEDCHTYIKKAYDATPCDPNIKKLMEMATKRITNIKEDERKLYERMVNMKV